MYILYQFYTCSYVRPITKLIWFIPVSANRIAEKAGVAEAAGDATEVAILGVRRGRKALDTPVWRGAKCVAPRYARLGAR